MWPPPRPSGRNVRLAWLRGPFGVDPGWAGTPVDPRRPTGSRTMSGPPAGGPGVREAGTRGARRRPAGGRPWGKGSDPPGAPSDGASDVDGAPVTVRGGPSHLIQREDGVLCACPCVGRASGTRGGRYARERGCSAAPEDARTAVGHRVTGTKHPGYGEDTAGGNAASRRRWTAPAARRKRDPRPTRGRGRRTT
jgi:hypothetical protein